MYEKRQALRSGDQRQLPIKIILNSIYGKTGQRVNRIIGNLFNPVIFAYITGFTRALLYRFVISEGLERDVVSFATDSVCTTHDLKITSSELGDFSINDHATDVFILQNGIYRFNGKWKQRGFGRIEGKDIEHLETFERNGRLFYKLKMLRSVRLRSSIIQNQLKDIGRLRPITRAINLNADRKRSWFGNLTSINRDCNDSVPLSLNQIGKDRL